MSKSEPGKKFQSRSPKKRKRKKKKDIRVIIAGRPVPVALSKIAKGRKRQVWILESHGGGGIALFETEEELERWWQKFQESLGREPSQLAIGPAKKKPIQSKRLKRPGRNAPSMGGSDDHMKPHSEKYDMPEYDAEHFGRM